MNRDNTYKQTEGPNQPMQLDLSKVLSRPTLTPTPKVCGQSRKGFLLDCVIIFTMIRSLIFVAQKPNHMS